jgi:hypothetical protein
VSAAVRVPSIRHSLTTVSTLCIHTTATAGCELLQLQTTRDDYIVAHPDRLQLLRNMGVEFSTATAAAALESSSNDVDTSDAAFEEVFEALAVSALRTVRDIAVVTLQSTIVSVAVHAAYQHACTSSVISRNSL